MPSLQFAYILLITLSTIAFLLFLSSSSSSSSLIYDKIKSKVVISDTLDEQLQINDNDEESLVNFDNNDNLDEFDKNLGNVPNIYLNRTTILNRLQINKTCGQYPKLFDIKFRETIWQIQQTKNGTLHLLNAYLDNRKLLKNQSKIRILSMLNRLNDTIQMYCLLWYNNNNSVIVQKSVKFLRIFTKGWGGDKNEYYQPYLITCNLPEKQQNYPQSITIVENLCDPITNNLLIKKQERIDKKQNFMVCVKGLNYPKSDRVIRLIEWIELLLILGAEKINFYEFNVHPLIKKVLNYYVIRENIELTPITLIGDHSNRPKLQNLFLLEKTIERRLQEVIPYNDCFYKYHNQYRYIILLDTDEVIIPKFGKWLDLLNQLENKYVLQQSFDKQPASYQARNVYFLDSHQHQHEWFNNIPKYLHMLQHVYRAKNHTRPGFYVKSFFNTERVLTLHNHFTRSCIGNLYCNDISIDIELGQLQHYRNDCVKDIRNCSLYKDERVLDTTIWNFKQELIDNVQKVLYDNGILIKKP